MGSDLIRRLRDERPDVVFVALHGRDGEDGTVQELLEILEIPYTGSGVLACSRAIDKVMTKHLLLERRHPDARTSSPSPRPRSASWARRTRSRRSRSGCEFPIVVKPSRQGSALGIKFARSAADVPGALVAAFSYDERVLLERHVAGPRPRGVGARGPDGPEALPIVEAVPARRRPYDYESRYDIGRTDVRVPGGAGRRGHRPGPGAGAGHLRAARGATASRAST